MSSPRTHEGYERSDAQARPLLLFGFGLTLLVAASLAASAWISQVVTAEIEGEEQPNPVGDLRKRPEGPQLQAVPARELEQHRAWERHTLESTEWIDPINRIVRIPIERAMELTLEEGLPARTEEPR